jgi:hypothetical protein
MKKWLLTLKSMLLNAKSHFFLRRHRPLESTLNILKDLYPNVNWDRVDFYEGLPWFTPAIAPYVTAQALPQFYSFGRYSIYLKKFDESRVQCLADIVHEAFHVMQASHFSKGYGFGFFRGWMIYYIALFYKYGYRQNPFEIEAYDYEYRFLAYCEKNGLHGIEPPISPGALKHISKDKQLVNHAYNFRYGESFLVLGSSFIFCILVALLKPVIDLLVFAIRFLVVSPPA